MVQNPFSFGAKFWNLDCLKPRISGRVQGELILQSLDKALGPHGRIGDFYDDIERKYRLLILDAEEGRLNDRSATDPALTIIHRWDRNESMDIFLDNRSKNSAVYLLNRSRGEIVRFVFMADRLQKGKSWLLNPHKLTPASRLALLPNLDGPATAYVGPVNENRIISVTLSNNPEIKDVSVALGAGSQPLGKELYFCSDYNNNSLIISDTENHRIIEFHSGDGTAEIICGTGKPGDASEGQIAKQASINSPRAVAVYSHRKVILETMLHPDYRDILTKDMSRVRPRAIIFADTDNYRIKKIVDLPRLAIERYDLPDDPLLYTLIGSGECVKNKLPTPTSQHKADLHTYPIARPLDLAVSGFGDLLIACVSSQTLISLRPATALAQEEVYRKGQKAVFEDS